MALCRATSSSQTASVCLTLGNMKPAQRTLAHALLASALSHRGHLEASTIMILEQILFEMEGRDIRDPYLYHALHFWKTRCLRHLGMALRGTSPSLNFTLVNGRIFSVTPSFWGSNPAEVKEGPYKGLKVLADEEDKARKFVRSLSLRKETWPSCPTKLQETYSRDKIAQSTEKPSSLRRIAHHQDEFTPKRLARRNRGSLCGQAPP